MDRPVGIFSSGAVFDVPFDRISKLGQLLTDLMKSTRCGIYLDQGISVKLTYDPVEKFCMFTSLVDSCLIALPISDQLRFDGLCCRGMAFNYSQISLVQNAG